MLPRNTSPCRFAICSGVVSIADATLASPQRCAGRIAIMLDDEFQSQTRRLLPRNVSSFRFPLFHRFVSIADATLASPQHGERAAIAVSERCFNRRRDACFPATTGGRPATRAWLRFNRRRDACFPATSTSLRPTTPFACFNRRRDACFPATPQQRSRPASGEWFQSQTRRLLPRNSTEKVLCIWHVLVSIADATLASPQPTTIAL